MEYDLALILNTLSVLGGIVSLLWSIQFHSRLQPATASSTGVDRAKALSKLKKITTVGIFFQLALFFFLQSKFHQPSFFNLGAILCQIFVYSWIENSIRGLKPVSSLDRLTVGLRTFLTVLGIILVCWSVLLFNGVVIFLGVKHFKLPVWFNWISLLLSFFEITLGAIHAAPLLVRLFTPCQKNKDPQILQLLELLCHRAGTPTPTLWAVNADRNASYNVFIAGMSWGKGVFQPGLFLTSPLISRLPPKELEAVLLHEISHLALHHPLKRLLVHLGLIVAMLSGFVAVQFSNIFKVSHAFSPSLIVFMISEVLGYLFITHWLSRTQEFAADTNALRLGADAQALTHALHKLTTLNDQLPTRNRFAFLFAPGAYPSTDERTSAISLFNSSSRSSG